MLRKKGLKNLLAVKFQCGRSWEVAGGVGTLKSAGSWQKAGKGLQ